MRAPSPLGSPLLLCFSSSTVSSSTTHLDSSHHRQRLCGPSLRLAQSAIFFGWEPVTHTMLSLLRTKSEFPLKWDGGSKRLEYGGCAWHEECFTCCGCEKPIGSQSFIPDKDEYYCVPCYEGRFAPRCAHCKQLLVQGGVTYRDEPWHKECFLCSGCKAQLAGQAFTTQGEEPYCVKCFSHMYAQKCTACNKPITGFGEGKYISFEERQWHQPCFTCSECSISLVGTGFFPNGSKILCKTCNAK